MTVVGGGPSGSGFALSLLKQAAEKNIKLNVKILEGKTFERSTHYNQCVGVVSPPIIELLDKDLDVIFPHELTQRVIEGYVLHGDSSSIELSGNHLQSFAFRRVNFDEYLLKEAENRGAEVSHSRVTNIEIHEDGAYVYTEGGNIHTDVIVGAFGLDDGTSRIFERDCRYRQPRFLDSIVTKVHPGMDFMEKYDNNIHAFLIPIHQIEFGAVTPKMNHLTINIAGSRINSKHMDEFLSSEAVKAVLPPKELWDNKLNYYKGRFPIRISKCFSEDRFVAIGDAAGMMRPFKGKGINSALVTGKRAAEVMLNYGISETAFNNYHQKCSDFIGDIPYGKALRFLTILLTRKRLIDQLIKIAKEDKHVLKILFDCVSGGESLKDIYKYMRRNNAIIKISYHFLNFRTLSRLLFN